MPKELDDFLHRLNGNCDATCLADGSHHKLLPLRRLLASLLDLERDEHASEADEQVRDAHFLWAFIATPYLEGATTETDHVLADLLYELALWLACHRHIIHESRGPPDPTIRRPPVSELS